MSDTPKVALLIETSRGYGRGMLRGIVRYARLHGPWGFYLTPGDFKQALPKMQQWGGTGIIAEVDASRIETRHAQGWVSKATSDLAEAVAWMLDARDRGEPLSVA